MTIGYLGVGGTMALLLVAGSSLMSVHRDGGLVFVVYVANIFGLGVATPTELLITRRYNVGAVGDVQRPRAVLLLVAVLTGAAAWVFAASSSAHSGDPWVGPGAALAVLGWVALISARSRLAGVGDLHAYAVVLVCESAARALLLVAAVLFRSASDALLFLGAGLPLLAAAAVAAAVHTTFEPHPEGAEVETQGREQLSFIVVLLGYQACLNLAPLLLAARTGNAAFGNANAYFRTPLVMLGGIYTHGLVGLSHAWGAGNLPQFRATLRGALRRTAVLMVAVSAAVSAAAPIALRVLYHPRPDLPLPVFAALAVSGVLAGLAVVTGLALQASGRADTAATAWLAAGIVTTAAFAVSNGTDGVAVAGLVLGPLLALVAMTLAVRRLLASPSGLPSPMAPEGLRG